MSLRRRAFRAVRWTAAGAGARMVVSVLQLAVLARILQPADYGLMAIVTVALTLTMLVSDLGVNSAFLQRREVTPEARSSLFWFSIAISFALALLLVGLSPSLATLFGDLRLQPLLMLGASTLVISAVGTQLRIVEEKRLRFGFLVAIEVAGALLGFVVATALAVSGAGVYALVAGSIAMATTISLLSWVCLARGWRPQLRLRAGDIRPFLGFGGALAANNLVNQLNQAVDLLLGGRMLTVSQLGLYSVPRNLALQMQSAVNPIITRVAFPLIAEVQNDRARVRDVYLQALNMTASTNAPAYLFVSFFAVDFVEVLLGEGWERSAGILQILGVWGALRALANPVGGLLLGTGRADLALKWNLALLLLSPPMLLLASQWGPEGLAAMLLCLSLVTLLPGWLFLVRPLCGASFGTYSLAAFRPFVLSALAFAPSLILVSALEGALTRLLAGLTLGLALYLLLSGCFNRHWIGATRELFGLARRP